MKAHLNRQANWISKACGLLVLANLAACGQNPSLTKPTVPGTLPGSSTDQQTAQNGSGAENKKSNGDGSGEDGSSGSEDGNGDGEGGVLPPVATTEPKPQDSGNGSVPPVTPEQIATPAPLNPPVNQPVLATPSCEDCVETYTQRFPVRKLTKAEMERLSKKLPYKSSDKSPGVKGNAFNVYSFGRSSSAKNNTMILMAVDVTALPPRNSITGVETATLSLDLGISGHNKTLNNQILCLPDYFLCSGEMVDTVKDRSYLNNFNTEFFATRKGPVNRYYSSQPVDDKVGRYSGRGNFKLDLGMLVAGTELDALKVLYGPNSETKWITPANGQTIYLLVAEDTGVKKNKHAYIEVTVNYDKKTAAAMDPSPVLEAPRSRRNK